MTREEALANYREKRDAYLVAAAREDAAFVKWFTKRRDGEHTNGGAASRLATQANYASADLAAAQGKLYKFDIDPADVDREDGVERTVSY